MKQVKVTVNEGSPGRTLYLFGSAEGAYVWLTQAYDDPEIIEKIPDVERVVLLPGEFIEAEWRGCEFAYDGPDHTRIDAVRLAKAHQPENASGLLVSIHFGWTVDCIIPFRQYRDDDIDVRPLPPEERKVDLAVLFKDNEAK